VVSSHGGAFPQSTEARLSRLRSVLKRAGTDAFSGALVIVRHHTCLRGRGRAWSPWRCGGAPLSAFSLVAPVASVYSQGSLDPAARPVHTMIPLGHGSGRATCRTEPA